jgi:amino acid transporter
MRRHTHPLRVLLAMLMMFGILSFTGTYALAGEEVPDGTPAGDGTAVAEPDDTGGSSVSALPETGNGPESDNSGSILMIVALAAILLVAVAVAMRRLRTN